MSYDNPDPRSKSSGYSQYGGIVHGGGASYGRDRYDEEAERLEQLVRQTIRDEYSLQYHQKLQEEEEKKRKYETRQVDNRAEYYRDHQADPYLHRHENAAAAADILSGGTHCAKDPKTCGDE